MTAATGYQQLWVLFVQPADDGRHVGVRFVLTVAEVAGQVQTLDPQQRTDPAVHTVLFRAPPRARPADIVAGWVTLPYAVQMALYNRPQFPMIPWHRWRAHAYSTAITF